MPYIQMVSGNVTWFDARIFNQEWDPLEDVIKAMFTESKQKTALMKALHLEESTRKPNFGFNSVGVKKGYT
jgi:hypothetical protein